MPVLIPLEKKIRFYIFLTNELLCCYILCRKAILRYSDFPHGQAWHLWCGPEAMGCGCELARKATPHSFWPIALLGAKDWPWFSYNINNVYACAHSSWGNKPWISSCVVSPRQGSSCLYLFMLDECQTMLVIFSTYITVHCPYNVNVQRWLHDSFFTASSCRIAVADPPAPICRPVGLQLPPRGAALAACGKLMERL